LGVDQTFQRQIIKIFNYHKCFFVGEDSDSGGYTTANVDELIDKTRQAFMANFDPEYILFLLHRHHTQYFAVNI